MKILQTGTTIARVMPRVLNPDCKITDILDTVSQPCWQLSIKKVISFTSRFPTGPPTPGAYVRKRSVSHQHGLRFAHKAWSHGGWGWAWVLFYEAQGKFNLKATLGNRLFNILSTCRGRCCTYLKVTQSCSCVTQASSIWMIWQGMWAAANWKHKKVN